MPPHDLGSAVSSPRNGNSYRVIAAGARTRSPILLVLRPQLRSAASRTSSLSVSLDRFVQTSIAGRSCNEKQNLGRFVDSGIIVHRNRICSKLVPERFSAPSAVPQQFSLLSAERNKEEVGHANRRWSSGRCSNRGLRRRWQGRSNWSWCRRRRGSHLRPSQTESS
jgi:hypothetical protein